MNGYDAGAGSILPAMWYPNGRRSTGLCPLRAGYDPLALRGSLSATLDISTANRSPQWTIAPIRAILSIISSGPERVHAVSRLCSSCRRSYTPWQEARSGEKEPDTYSCTGSGSPGDCGLCRGDLPRSASRRTRKQHSDLATDDHDGAHQCHSHLRRCCYHGARCSAIAELYR